MKLLSVLLLELSMGTLLFGQTAPNLRTVATYAAFSGVGGITSTGLTQLIGDVGTNAGEFSGFPPGVYSGEKHVADPASLVAKNDLTDVWNDMGAIPCDAVLSVTMGNGQVLTPQTYCTGAASTLTGTMTLDARGNPNAIFIIKVGGALNVAGNSNIVLINSAQASNVYWRIDGAVSILDNSIFKGTIVANGAIHLYGGTSLEGRALATVGAITMASNRMTVPVGIHTNGLIVVRPAAGDTLTGGTKNYRVGFTGGNAALPKTIEYSLDSGATWNLLGIASGDSSSYPWNVPETTSVKAFVRVTESSESSDTSGMFVIKAGTPVESLVVVRPAAGDTLIGGTMNYRIEFTGASIALPKTIEYSLDGGATWNIVGVVIGEASSYSWNVPETTSVTAFVRVTESSERSGTSGMFVIASGTHAGVNARSALAGYSISNFPNPVSGATTIRLLMPTRGVVRIAVADQLGKDVGTVAWRSFEAGAHDIPFDASQLSSGIYTYTLTVGKTRISGTMTVVK